MTFDPHPCQLLIMASKGNNEYDFIEQPPVEFFCPISFVLLCEPYLTECCGNHVSSEAYLQVQGQPCPMCREEKYVAIKDKYYRRKVMSLKVRCPHKAESCEWEGELGSLEQHLSTNSCEGECEYVDVECSRSCGERVQRRNLEEHKSQNCVLRPFTCQYCNHEATYREVTKEHWPVCEKYPLPCPNECGEEEMERQHLKIHLEQTCPLEVIKCELNYAGCGAQLQRRLMSAHMKENTESHLLVMMQEVPKLIQQERDKMKQMGEKIAQLNAKLKRQRDHIRTLSKAVIPPFDVVMNDFRRYKDEGTVWYSPPFYSHPGGYKMCLKVYANGYGRGEGTHVSVFVFLMRGELDDDLKWPFCGDITVELHHHRSCYRTTTQVISMNGSSSTEARQRPIIIIADRNEKGLGIHRFISHEDIYIEGYNYCNNLKFYVSKVSLI